MEQLPDVLFYIDLYENFNNSINFFLTIGFIFGIFVPFIFIAREDKPKKLEEFKLFLKKVYTIWGILFLVALLTPTNRTFELMILKNYYGKDYPKMIKYLPDFKDKK